MWQARRQANTDSSTTTVTAAGSGAVGSRDAVVTGGAGPTGGRDATSMVGVEGQTAEQIVNIFPAPPDEAAADREPPAPATLTNLGLVLDQLGEQPAARAHFERALAIEEAAYGPDHPQVAATLTNLGLVLRELGELQKAQACEQRAQAVRQEISRSQ